MPILTDQEQEMEDDARMDAYSEFVEAWRDDIDEWRHTHPNDQRDDYAIAVMFQKEENDDRDSRRHPDDH